MNPDELCTALAAVEVRDVPDDVGEQARLRAGLRSRRRTVAASVGVLALMVGAAALLLPAGARQALPVVAPSPSLSQSCIPTPSASVVSRAEPDLDALPAEIVDDRLTATVDLAEFPGDHLAPPTGKVTLTKEEATAKAAATAGSQVSAGKPLVFLADLTTQTAEVDANGSFAPASATTVWVFLVRGLASGRMTHPGHITVGTPSCADVVVGHDGVLLTGVTADAGDPLFVTSVQ